MTTAIVTGGLGFIGHHLVEYLLGHTDYNIVVLDTGDLPHSEERVNSSERVEYVYCDLADDGWMKNIVGSRRVNNMLNSPDFIFNLASNSHVDTSIQNPSGFVKNNLLLQVNVLEYARQFGCEKFVQVSTDEVFGPILSQEGIGFDETSTHYPSNPYSASKSCQEQMCNAWWQTYKMPIVVVNSMNNYGIRQECEKFIPKVIGKILYGQLVNIHCAVPCLNTGEFVISSRAILPQFIPGSRGWINVEDFCHAVYLSSQYKGCSAEMPRFNVGGERRSNEEIVDQISSVMGMTANKVFVDGNLDRPGHDIHYGLDDSWIKKRLGWKIERNIDDSLPDIVTWYLENKGVWLCP